MMQKTTATTVDYYIIFTNSQHKHWLLKRLKKKYQHVFAVKKSVGGCFWIIINPLISYTYIDIVPVLESPHIRTLLIDPENSVIVPVTATIGEKERHTFCIINCVEIVKSLLGIRAFWVWTPYQLYKYLKRGNKNG